tara:strand:+ start:51 stop:440 length:390 start_codon:yes stop_codon:yes gene_type:complete
MPFIATTRCGFYKIELEVGEVCGELQNMLQKKYSGDIKEGSKFWSYVIQIENNLNKCNTIPDIWEWFGDNYNNVEMWNEIQDLFVEEDEERYCELEEGCPYTSYVWGETKDELEGKEYICDKCKQDKNV